VVPLLEVNSLVEPQEAKVMAVLVEETVNPPHYLLETSVLKQQLMVSNHSSLNAVTLRMLESP
jgi:hypothetical protein